MNIQNSYITPIRYRLYSIEQNNDNNSIYSTNNDTENNSESVPSTKRLYTVNQLNLPEIIQSYQHFSKNKRKVIYSTTEKTHQFILKRNNVRLFFKNILPHFFNNNKEFKLAMYRPQGIIDLDQYHLKHHFSLNTLRFVLFIGSSSGLITAGILCMPISLPLSISAIALGSLLAPTFSAFTIFKIPQFKTYYYLLEQNRFQIYKALILQTSHNITYRKKLIKDGSILLSYFPNPQKYHQQIKEILQHINVNYVKNKNYGRHLKVNISTEITQKYPMHILDKNEYDKDKFLTLSFKLDNEQSFFIPLKFHDFLNKNTTKIIKLLDTRQSTKKYIS